MEDWTGRELGVTYRYQKHMSMALAGSCAPADTAPQLVMLMISTTE